MINVVYQIHIGPYKQIGSTSKLKTRMKNHLNALKENRHWNSYMQSVYNKHQSFEYEILFSFDTREEAYAKEQELLDLYFNKEGYTMLHPKAIGGSLPGDLSFNKGRKYSQETIDKRRAKTIGLKHTEEYKKKASERVKEEYASGKRVHPFLGRKHSDEAKKKMSLARKGKPLHPNCIAANKEWMKQNNPFKHKKFIGEENHFYGKKHTEETKRKIAEKNRFSKPKTQCEKCGRWYDPGNYKQHISKGCKVTKSQIDDIIRLYTEGNSILEISRRTVLGVKLIKNIIKESKDKGHDNTIEQRNPNRAI